MRRAHALAASLSVVTALAACGTPGTTGPSGSPTGPATTGASSTEPTSTQPTQTSASASPSASVGTGARCAAEADALSLDERVGQVFMLGLYPGQGVSDDQLDQVGEDNIGAVLYLGGGSVSQSSARSLGKRVAKSGAAVPPLVAADQEGGAVQRLDGEGFSTIPSARRQAAMSDAELRKAAKRWGAQLAAAGVHWDLAPVADVVPASKQTSNEPIGALGRGYGSSPAAVAKKSVAFTKGMHDAGIAVSYKHFPNLGQTVGNTDFSAGVRDSVTTRKDPALAPYRAGIAAGTDSIMVSTTIYTKIDPAQPAVFSRKVMTIIRDDLGYEGVIISDDMGGAAQVAGYSPGVRAVRFLQAGGDMVINGNPAIMAAMIKAVRAEAKDDPEFAQALTEHTRRILVLKADQGLITCG